MTRHYRMTAARRAALRKAQIASAKKRRRRKTAAKTALAIGVFGVGALAGSKINKTNVLNKRAMDSERRAWAKAARGRWHTQAHRKFVRDAVFGQPLAISKTASKPVVDVTTFGKRRAGGGVIKDRSGRDRGNPHGLAKITKGQAQLVVIPKAGGIVVGSSGSSSARIVQRLRGLYNNGQRWGYDSNKRHVKYVNVDKPRRQAQAAARKKAKGK